MRTQFIIWSIILIILFLILLLFYGSNNRHDTGIYIYQMNSEFNNMKSSENITSPFKEIVNEYNWKKGLSFKNCNLIVFNDYTNIDQKLGTLPFNRMKKYYINGMSGLDQLCSKSQMAIWLRKNNYHDIIPKTYCLDNDHDLSEFINSHRNIHYILKKNIQRQTGLKITNDHQWIINNAKNEEYVVAQELLKDPYLISGRKINIRVYMAVIRIRGKMKFFIYSDGFMYYTKELYDPDNFSLETNITTGYIDRDVYEKNPLTTRDFMKYLGYQGAHKLLVNMYGLFQKIKKTFHPLLVDYNKNIPGTLFNVFGVDIAPDKELRLSILEQNKGCSLVYMDDRDRAVKYNMIRDLLGIINLVDDSSSDNFIEIK